MWHIPKDEHVMRKGKRSVDTAAIVIVDALLSDPGIREVARRMGRPPSSVVATLRRTEDALAMRFLQPAGQGLMRTLEGERLQPVFSALAAETARLFRTAPGAPVPMLGLEALHRVLTVARKGSIRAAARELGLGQPQLTRQIAHVEARAGITLFHRSADGAVPTGEGQAFIDAARRIEDLWRGVSARSGEKFRRLAATVRLGSVFPLGAESSIAGLLARLSAQWRLHHPRQPLFITSMIAEELLNGVRRGLFDLVLLDLETVPEDLEGKLLASSPLMLVASRETAERAGGALANLLLTSPLAVPSARSGLRQIIDRMLEGEAYAAWRGRIDPVEVDSIPVILRMVEDHGFIAFLPAASLPPGHLSLAALPLPVRTEMPLYAAWPRGRGDPGLVERLLSLARP